MVVLAELVSLQAVNERAIGTLEVSFRLTTSYLGIELKMVCQT
jgi:hypothetical protein